MPNLSALFLRTAILIADSASMFAGFAIIGFIAYQATSPLPWPIIFGVLTVGTLVFHTVNRFTASGSGTLTLYGGVGFIVSYGAVAGMTDMDWLAAILQGRYGVSEALRIGFAFLASAYLWFHAASMLMEKDLTQRLVRRFRFGIAWFVLAMIVEVGSGRDLQVGNLLWPFLVAGLAALAVNRFGGGLAASSFRLRLAAFTVLFVVGFGAAAGAVGDSVSRGLWTVVVTVFRWPLEVLRDGYLWAVSRIFNPIIGKDSSLREGPDPLSSLEGLGRREYDPNASAIDIEWQGWAILAIVIFLAYLIYRFYLGPSDDLDERQKLARGTADDSIPFVGDAARLVRGMASRRRKSSRTVMSPRSTGTDGQRETFELYRRLVTVACDHGHAFDEAETPNERASDLEAVLPQAPITKLTGLVNTSCFAGQDVDAATVDDMRQEIEKALHNRGA